MKIPKNVLEILKKQHYAVVGKNSGVQICRWNKKSLLDQGVCYKEKFYGIKSHLCCQMSPCVLFCENSCLHCWRAIEYGLGDKMNKKDAENPKELINECIKAQRKLLSGFKGNKNVNIEKWKEAQNPTQFAISLSGEPTIYPYLKELIKELRKQGKTSFLVSNGLNPEVFKKLEKEKALPTQLYISLNTSNEKDYKKWHNSKGKNSWKKFNESLDILNKLTKKGQRTVLRMTLVKNKNMKEEDIIGYIKLMKKASPMFIEVKGYMSVGFARQRLGYETMPTHEDIKHFAKMLEKELKPQYKILDEKIESRIVLLGRKKSEMKINFSKI
jgi:tRNA wybutosine-synthesizing protein 1